MEGIEEVSWKRRATSATSSNSSVIEYVNEVFTESELEMSKSVNVEVTENTISVENPLTGVQVDKKDIVVDKKADFSDNVLQDFPVRSGSFQEVIEKGFRNMYLSALVVLLFAICMGVTATYTATATEDMKKKHSSIHPSSDDVTWIGSLMAVGALIGGSAGGYFTNTLGRKGTLMFNTAPFVAGWLFIIYAPSTGWIFIGRILSGFCVGIVSVATPMYLIEISTPEVRGLLGASFQLFVVIGILIVASLGSFLTWRNLAVSGAIICLTAAFLMLPMPESPRWLMAQKRREEAKRAFRFLQGKSFNSEAECKKIEEEIKNQPIGRVQMKEFLVPIIYKPFILSILLMFFQQFSGVNAILFYTVDIFKSAGSSLDPIRATIYVSVVQVIATAVGSILMDRAGRKPLLMISGICMAMSLIVFGGFDLAKRSDASVSLKFGWLPLVCLMAFISAFSIGYGPTPWLMVAEMIPVRYRGFISAVATGLNWTFVFIVTKSFKATEEILHSYGVYWLYSTFCIISCLVTFFFLPETKGKKLEEIQPFFEPKNANQDENLSKSF
ncbi:facilitated trehalose transporter Tret1-2 homolog isoform X1 [Stegodyphus dumicola]|uniref:facilitated trehalose transporter Tret1-2 homolog isoform X1 n=2 Tax=Stegodyphus dumicola TaxID=202533 RepID=UPI0015AAFB54|nr:facilitated trehalose transporter Tret1-2 homolog isoform X1 [Stegodyphus dumicola]